MTTQPQSRIDVLDGLRGIAILIVVWFHTWQVSWLAANVHILGRTYNFNFIPEDGFLGVDLFFFLSGFVLFYPYARHLFEGKRRQSLREFAYRRAIKIVPSYLLSVLLVLLIARPDIGTSAVDLARQFITHALFVFNWWPQTSGAINGVLWTLAVEVQFYVLFPLLCAALMRWPAATYIGLLVIANVYRGWVLGCCLENGYRLIYQLPAYIDIFAAGMLAAYLFVYIRARVPAAQKFGWLFGLGALASLALLGALLVSLFTVRYEPNIFESWQATHRVYLGWTFLALGLSSTLASRWWHLVLGNPLLVFYATISYNLYLYHQVIADQMYVRFHWPRSATPDPHNDPHWQLTFTLLAFAISTAFTALVTYAFERPLLKDGPKALLFWRHFRRTTEPAGA